MKTHNLLTTLSLRAIRELAYLEAFGVMAHAMSDDELARETGIVWAQYEDGIEYQRHYACMVQDPTSYPGYKLASFYVKLGPYGDITGGWGGLGYDTERRQ